MPNEEKYKVLIERSPEAMLIIDELGQLRYLNPAAEKLGGYTIEETKGTEVKDFIHPDDQQDFGAMMLELVENADRVITPEYRIGHKDGHYIWIEGSICNCLQDKNIRGFIAYYRDITKRKKAEAETKESLQHLDTIFNKAPLSMIEMNEQGEVINWNLLAENTFGWSAEEAIGKPLTDLIIPERYRAAHTKGMSRYAASGEMRMVHRTMEVFALHKDQHEFPIQLNIAVTKKNDTVSFIGFIIDFTKHRKDEEEILSLSKAVAQNPASVMITDLMGNIEYVNQKFETITGYSAEEVMGKNPKFLKSGEMSPNQYENLWATILNKETWHGDLHNVKKDGTLFWERASIGPILDDKGKIISLMAVKEDITREKEIELQLYDTLEGLEELVTERTKELSETAQKLEDTHKDLISSLQYAKLIQGASIPHEQELKNGFQDAFVIFKPRDIVSGDFYWCHHGAGESIVALVDCTGHGVPGAMLSMAGFELLDSIVINREIRSPDIILEKMDKRINALLQNKDSTSSMNDGMDMSIVHIDHKNQVLSYAGANSNGLLIHKGNVIGLKPDRESIGGMPKKEAKEFNCHRMKFELGDRLYLYSDGIYDQFGGPNAKKMMRKNLEANIVISAKKSLKEQKVFIENTFLDWKGTLAQIDDVTLLGFQL